MNSVKVIVGDLLKSRAQTLVNTVNCVGVMGKGIALAFKKKFPEMYKDYVSRCVAHEVKLGRPYLYMHSRPWVLNFPTKDHWRGLTRLVDLEKGLEYLLANYKGWGIESIAVPPLGCGLGQLEWRVVGPTLYRFLQQMEIPVELYAPHGTPHQELSPSFLQGELFEKDGGQIEAQWIRPGWVALVEILDRLERQPYHPFVGRTFFQKIAYVATSLGIPTDLRFMKGSFGPFSNGLKGMESRLINNGLISEQQIGQMFKVSPGATYSDARKAYAQQLGSWSEEIERVVDLFMRMDTKQAEVAATVLFAAAEVGSKQGATPTERKVFDYVAEWKQDRKPSIDLTEFALAIRNLAALGWLQVTASKELPVPSEAVDA